MYPIQSWWGGGTPSSHGGGYPIQLWWVIRDKHWIGTLKRKASSMILCFILFTVVSAAKCQVLTESFVIRLKELEALAREQRNVIENLRQMKNIDGYFEILTNIKQRPITGKCRGSC